MPNTLSPLTGLRGATRDVHERLHEHPAFAPLTATPPDLAGYARLLGLLHGFHGPTEAWLFGAAERLVPELTDLPERRKAHLLRADLAALASISHPSPTVARVHIEQGAPLSRPALLGSLYVTEGATLGGRELGRRLHPALKAAGLTGEQGRSYFLAYGASQGDMWRRFCSVLGAAMSKFTPTEHRAMETAARNSFLGFESWLTQNLAAA